MKKLSSLLILIFAFVSCQDRALVESVQIIPQPVSVSETHNKPFDFDEDTRIIINDSSLLAATASLNRVLKMNLLVLMEQDVDERRNDFVFQLDSKLDSLSGEGYSLQISKDEVLVRSAGAAGAFYAVQTIRQMLPAELETLPVSNLALLTIDIIDSPRFPWRGMHLDVSRHFMPIEFIKKYIDYLAMHKLNTFHWHLVDGIGWRIEIKSHPELTDIGAWRVVKEDKKPWQDFEVWKEGDDRPKYGGYYTQDEIREVVAYAISRYITVLPEIELPGHSEVVFQCYPELVCKDRNNKHLRNIGVYCASNPEGYKLLEDILDEVIELFPSEYIHIGGDEVNKQNWENCADCQQFMKENDYTPHELQSYFVNHFDEYLKSKGRKLIGWHEILEGDLSETATIMYWGGEKGVADNLKKGHPMVLTTGSHLYFDHYQSLSKEEPKAFGGYSPLKKVYDYEPVPDNLEKQYKDLVIGVQANVWTEYMTNPDRVEYMTMPRMAALSEIAWQLPGTKDWDNFRIKMDGMLDRYQAMNINYATSAFRPGILFELDRESKKLHVSLETELLAEIYFTLDGSDPDPAKSERYTSTFVLEESATVKAIAVKNGKVMGVPETKDAVMHKARGAKVSLDLEPSGRYSARGGYTLVDTDFGGDKWGNGKWLGILQKDFTATIEFNDLTEVSKIGYSCIEETGPGIFFPAGIEVAVSDDGKTFKTVKTWSSNRQLSIPLTPVTHTKIIELDFEPTSCKYLSVKTIYQRVSNSGVFVFVDEIIVE